VSERGGKATLHYIDRTCAPELTTSTFRLRDEISDIRAELLALLGSPCHLPRQRLVKELYISHKEYQLWFDFIPLVRLPLINMGDTSRYIESVSGNHFGVKETYLLHQSMVIS